MEVGCGGVGLRTSRGDVVNLYFWHVETVGGERVRQEDFLGRADSPRVRRELLRRMALYDRRMQQRLARSVAKLERQMARYEPEVGSPPVTVEGGRPRESLGTAARVFAGARGI